MESNLDRNAIGPQYPKDNPFAARMRFHQSWYRARVLKVVCGRGPTRHSPTFYGNYLTLNDGEQGFNFFTTQLGERIFNIVKNRLANKSGAIDPYRLLCNLLSSQPMCFNLFGALADQLELATTLFSPLYFGHISQVTKVMLEYAPAPANEYLNDHTAFDAFVEYIAVDGEKGFIGIETKLVEPFTLARHEHAEYWKWTNLDSSPWIKSTVLNLRNIKVNQLWRDHLLGQAIQHHPHSEYKHGHFLVINHSGDIACRQSLDEYQSLLKPEDRSFKELSLDELVGTWKPIATSAEDSLWLQEFSLRYINIEASENEYQAHVAGLTA